MCRIWTKPVASLAKHFNYGNFTWKALLLSAWEKVFNYSYLHILWLYFLSSPDVVMHWVLGILTFLFCTVHLRVLIHVLSFTVTFLLLTLNLPPPLWSLVQLLQMHARHFELKFKMPYNKLTISPTPPPTETLIFFFFFLKQKQIFIT